MPGRKSVVRKLTLVVIAIVTLVIAAAGLVNHAISHHYALESAREVLRFNSESILNGIHKLMLSRNNEGVLELLQDISKDSRVYREIRLVSHYSGEVVVSRLREGSATLTQEDHSCAICHDRPEALVTSDAPLDDVIDTPGGGRILRVSTPIANESSCNEADCHAHAESGPTLGFLEAEYSLEGIDALLFGSTASFVVAAVTAIALGAMALWIMFERSLGKPIRYMISGIQAVSGDDLSFRFRTDREDEFGLVEESFDQMATRIEAQQTELRAGREYLEGIVENSADFIITVNSRGLIETVNRGAELALGYQREELIGKPIELLFADPRERDVAIGELEDQDNVTNYATRFLTKDREVKHVLLTLSRLRDREGKAIGTIGISKDVTNEKELQDRLVQSQAAAAIGQAVTAIQHAIKNMLNTLTGGSYLVRHGITKDNKERMEEGVAMIDEGIATIGDLSSNMLKYAKTWKLEPETTDLGQMVQNICRAVERTAAEKAVVIHCNAHDDLPPVSCDARLIHMALMDIATNAMDACFWKSYEGEEKAEIEIRVYVGEQKDAIVVEVGDNGIGMTEEIKASIFTPFFSTKEQWGTGLGLALTSRIVNLHGGTIDVESQPDRGSLFRITLPVPGVNTNQGVRDGQEGRGNR
jgi:PAS domain S-box-containing protein